MKKLYFMLLCSLLAGIKNLSAQDLRGESRWLNLPRPLPEYNQEVNKFVKTAGDDANIYQSVPARAKFTIADETDHGYVIYFWDWKPDPQDKSTKGVARNNYFKKLNRDSVTHEQKYFLIKKQDIDRLSTKIYKRASPSFGILNLPFKYRPNDGAFEKTFSLSFTGGVKINPWRTGVHTLSVLVGAGASSVELNKFNTDPKGNITENTDRPAVTGSLNILYQWEKLQFGVSMGKDAIFNNRTDYWHNQGKTWLSFGIGLAIFSNGEITTPGKN